MKYYVIENNLILTGDKETLEEFYGKAIELPEDYEQGKYIALNGELTLNPDWINDVKQQKISENDIARDIVLNRGVTYQGILFDSDTDQKVNLLATVSKMGDTDTIIWFGMDNQPLECTKQDLLNIGGLITQLHSFCWNKNAEIKEQINEAKTIEEAKGVEINYEFSISG